LVGYLDALSRWRVWLWGWCATAECRVEAAAQFSCGFAVAGVAEAVCGHRAFAGSTVLAGSELAAPALVGLVGRRFAVAGVAVGVVRHRGVPS
jgi:hypothetical protein